MKTAALTFPLLAGAIAGVSAHLRHGNDGVNNMEIVSTPLQRELDWDYEVERPEREVDTEAAAEDEEPSLLREREMESCGSGEENVKLTFKTDSMGFETSWILSKAWNGNEVDSINQGEYGASQTYQKFYCLKSDKDYSLVVKDQGGDGMGDNGSFTVKVQKSNGGWKTIASGGQFANKVTETFTVPSYSSDTSSSSSSSSNNSSGSGSSTPGSFSFTSRMGCPSGQRKVKMEMKVDRYGGQDNTSWQLVDKNSGSVVAKSKQFSANEYEAVEKCLPAGQYELRLSDDVGDGICCSYDQGYYTFSMEDNGIWDEVINGGSFKKKTMSHFIFIGSTFMTDRAEEWLVAHNSRREYWHKTHYKKEYVPLKWSQGLADEAKKYAQYLLSTCDSSTIVHDPNTEYGENMAKNKGTGSWGEEKPADNIVARFVDREVDLPYPQNAHLSQALWRASKYVGCADADTPHNGGTCRIQVCRYSKAGNCAINANTWESKMLEDDSLCGPTCPPEGCF